MITEMIWKRKLQHIDDVSTGRPGLNGPELVELKARAAIRRVVTPHTVS